MPQPWRLVSVAACRRSTLRSNGSRRRSAPASSIVCLSPTHKAARRDSPVRCRMLTSDEHDLLLAYLSCELPAEQVAALEVRLKAEPAVADALVILAREESILTEWAHSSAGGLVETSQPSTGSTPAIPTAGRLLSSRRRRFVFAARWGAAAATIAIVVWGVFK